MAHEEKIQSELVAKFGLAPESCRVQRERRLFLTVDQAQFAKVFDFAVKSQQFSILCTITGIDEGEMLAFMYHLARTDGTMLNLKVLVPKATPKHHTVSEYFPSAVLYERELIDLLGAEITGLAPGFRYPLPEDWPAGIFPLRKDWTPPPAGTRVGETPSASPAKKPE